MMKKKVGLTIGALVLAGGAAIAIAAPGFGGCDGPGGWGKGWHGGKHDSHFQGAVGMKGARLLQVLDWELELSDQQHDQIRSLLKERQQDMIDHRQQMQQLFLSMGQLDPTSSDYPQQVNKLAAQQGGAVTERISGYAQTYADIYGLLNAEQQRRFNSLKQKWGERWQNRWGKSQERN